MITYVNTVLVGKGVGTLVENMNSMTAGQYVVVDNDNNVLNATKAAKAEAIKVGLVTDKNTVNHKDGSSMPVIKWSNIIKKADIKSYKFAEYEADTEDVVTIDLTNASGFEGKRIVVRLTYKDLPTRFRKWSESYDFLCAADETKATLAAKIVAKINKEYKRARVTASVVDGTKVVLEAMKYTDDDAVDTINVYDKVRFNANVWMTDPVADGFDKNNKYSVPGISIEKTPGKTFTASAKLVRDAEAQAMGYLGILNRGEGTWPIIKPEMNVDLSAHYDSITLEFENMYRAADDIQRKTKQTLQIFDKVVEDDHKINSVKAVIEAFVKGENKSTNALAQGTVDTADDAPAYSD